MASTSRDRDREGVEYVREDDGSVTARDLETGLERGGDTRAEALAQLAEVLRLEAGEGEPIDDPDEFLRYEHPETGEVRNVDVPQHDEIRIGTLRSILEQCGADDFDDWCAWIDEHA